jgi:hypothetical protein
VRRPPRTALGAAALVSTWLALSTVGVSAQTLRGILLENVTYRPIELGTVVLVRETGDTVAASLTDAEGFFSLTAPEPGTYNVIATSLGYTGRGRGPFELDEGEVQVVEVTLDPAPVPIEGVGVETTPIIITDDELLANGFYERLMEGRGQFLTPQDIARSEARYTPHLFRDLKYVHPQYGAGGWQTWVRVWSPLGRGTCVPRVYVDDVWVNRAGWEQYLPGQGLDDVIDRDDIKAAELYWGHQAPLRYRARDSHEDASADCGVVLLWTKPR